MSKTITWTREKLEELKNACKAAVDRGDDKFVYAGDAYLVSFANYLIEYLEGVIK